MRPGNKDGLTNRRDAASARFEVVRVIPLSCRTTSFVLALVLLLSASGIAATPKESRRVLILYSEEKGHPAHDLTDQGIRAAFRSNELFEVRVYAEYLDVSRFSGPGHAAVIAEYLRRKYSGTKIDAVIAVYPSAMEFLLANKRAPFHGVPIIACVISRSMAESLEHSPARRFITGQISGENAIGVLDDALRMRPGTKSVVLVAGTTPTDEYTARLFREALTRYTGRLDLTDLTRLPMREILARVGSLPPDAIVLYPSIYKDGAGQHFVPREALSRIARAANAPVFGLFDAYMGFGIVGGPLISFDGAGKSAAGLALRVMAGESPGDIPFTSQGAYAYVYDWRELKRWGIHETSLPQGSTLLYKEFSLWESYRWYIIGILAFCLVESFLVVALVLSLRKRRKALNDLAASETRYRTVADYTYDWEYWSAPDGKLLYVSPSCERITGYAPRYFIEDPARLREIILPEDRFIWDAHDHDMRTKLEPGETHFSIRTRDGEVRWVDHACQPVTDQQGQFLGRRASNRDVTERRMAELEAQQWRDELAHVTRVAAMGELTSSLAHELNQPLAAILNYANAAQRFLSGEKPDLNRAREALGGIARDDKRATEVIGKVRELLKKEEPHYVPLDINSVIQETLALVRGDSILKGSSLVTNLAPGLPTVTGDRVQLQQVILNLILNAVAAMRTLDAASRSLVVKTERYQDKSVRVSVRDSGTGIDEAHKAHIFEPFYTTKPSGIGMGLAISQRIIDAFGGSISAENNPDRGATFSFTVPAAGNGRDTEIGRYSDAGTRG
jgi:PAS domain S-box-containing protein